MAATVAGAFKAMIEAAKLGVSAYRGDPPQAAKLPYLVITEGIAMVHQPAGRNRETQRVVETVQLDLYQDKAKESYTLPDAVTRLLLTGKPGKAGASDIRQVQVTGGRRIPDPDPLVIRHSWNADCWRTV